MLNHDDIRAARARIAPHLRRTPLFEIAAQDGRPPISIKLESLQRTGSFKARGAFNAILSGTVPKAGVIAASGGNHGAAVACAAQSLGVPARIFVPTMASPVKISRIRHYGAEVLVEGDRYADALALCEAHAASSGAKQIHAFDAAETVAGQGTIAPEWEEDLDRLRLRPLDTVLIAVGGGGLIAGIAAWFAGRVKVVGVEPAGSCALHAAMQAGHPVDVTVQSVAADSLGAKRTGDLNLAIAKLYVDHIALVSDEQIIAARQSLWDEWRIATEAGGAAAWAALQAGVYQPDQDERVGVLLCGGNVDPQIFA
ncbi:threonine/serine dehydratase [Lichenihabitans psoromatis]|uniref:threonine/serine dehydratase n=1 Tax=Lichenihabitans psoromatis TaxID=2528642 RepID=UPI001035D422|nr:threonine/serine dehydratase [Lichenihabitans psoromatis]